MDIPNFLACPNGHTGRFRETALGLTCDGCEKCFPVLLGIIDFRDVDSDKTAAFSIAEDRLLAERLSAVYKDVTTFNELYDIYKALISKVKRGEELTSIGEVCSPAGESSGPRFLNQEQLVHGKAILEKISEYVRSTTHDMPPNNIALENGCGLGLFVDGLATHFKKLVVLDFSLCYLILARKIAEERKLSNVTLVCGTVERLPLQDNALDFIHSNNVIEHVSDQRALFKEAKRVLNSKGLLFVLSPNRFSLYFEPHFRLPCYGFIPKPVRRRIIRKWQHRDIDEISLLSLGELRELAVGQFGEDVRISFIPRYLNKTVTGGYIRNILVRSLNSRMLGPITNLLVNRALLGLMPYHTAICFKAR